MGAKPMNSWVKLNKRGQPVYEGTRPGWATPDAERRAADLQSAPRLRLDRMSIAGQEMGGYSGAVPGAQENLEAERMWRMNNDPMGEGPDSESWGEEYDRAQSMQGPQQIRDMYLARAAGYYDKQGRRRR